MTRGGKGGRNRHEIGGNFRAISNRGGVRLNGGSVFVDVGAASLTDVERPERDRTTTRRSPAHARV
jgi:hypothetical protein